MNISHRRAGGAALAAALTAVTATAAALAGPARADDGPVLHLSGAASVGLSLPPDDGGRLDWDLDTQGGTVHDLHVTVDLTGVAGFAASPDGNCSADLCAWDRGEADADGADGVLDLRAAPDAAPGSTGTAVVTATAADATISGYTVQVTVGGAESGGSVGLVVGGSPATVAGAVPGSTISAPLTIADNGSLASTATDWTFAVSPGLSFAQKFANCDYSTGTGPADDSAGRTVELATCHFTTPVAPGRRYALSTPLKLKVGRSALFEFLSYQAVSTSSDTPAPTTGASGTRLGLVADGSAPAGGRTHAEWVVNAANTADLAVTGATVTAAPGGTAALTATVTNHGPASVAPLTRDDRLSLLVDIPKGTTATTVPAGCGRWAGGGSGGEPVPGASQYLCALDQPFDSGHSEKVSFTVTVDADAPATTTGDVRPLLADGGLPAYDTDASDSTGRFTVDVSAPAATAVGTTARTGGSSAAGRTPAAPSSAAPTPPDGSGGGSSSGGPGSLASTGGKGSALLAWLGAAALAFGGAAFALSRVRRGRTAGA